MLWPLCQRCRLGEKHSQDPVGLPFMQAGSGVGRNGTNQGARAATCWRWWWLRHFTFQDSRFLICKTRQVKQKTAVLWWILYTKHGHPADPQWGFAERGEEGMNESADLHVDFLFVTSNRWRKKWRQQERPLCRWRGRAFLTPSSIIWGPRLPFLVVHRPLSWLLLGKFCLASVDLLVTSAPRPGEWLRILASGFRDAKDLKRKGQIISGWCGSFGLCFLLSLVSFLLPSCWPLWMWKSGSGGTKKIHEYPVSK